MSPNLDMIKQLMSETLSSLSLLFPRRTQKYHSPSSETSVLRNHLRLVLVKRLLLQPRLPQLLSKSKLMVKKVSQHTTNPMKRRKTMKMPVVARNVVPLIPITYELTISWILLSTGHGRKHFYQLYMISSSPL